MRLAYARNDDAAFERVVNTPSRGIGNKTIEILRERAKIDNSSLWSAAESLIVESKLTQRASISLQGFLDMILQVSASSKNLDLDEFSEHVINKSGLIDFHGKEAGEKGLARVENLQELINATRQFEVEDENNILREFLDTAALDAGEQQADEHADAVQLMTLHSAKGLEFPIVYLAGVEENLFPHKMSIDEPGRLEGRRLCYVGITRAKLYLYLTYAETRRWYGQETYNSVSRFVREIPKECINEVRLNNNISRPLSAGFSNTTLTESSSLGLQLGQRVKHSKFGEGVILNIEGQDNNARLQVNFDNVGS